MLVELARLERRHGRAQALGRASDPVRILEVRRRFSTIARPRVAGSSDLKMPGAHEDAFRAE
jgi:hypothetical protein